MRGLGKVMLVGLAAAGLLLLAAVLNLRGTGDAAVPAAPVSASALLSPAAGGGSLDASVAALQDRLRRVPDDWRGYAELGLAYVAQARVTADPSWYARAEGALRESQRLHPEGNVEALVGLGALDLARHDFGRALKHAREAGELAPGDPDVLGVLGDALLELGRYDQAFETFQAMVDARPDLASYARASYARELLGDVPGAIAAMRLAFSAAASPADAAWAAHQLGQLELGRGSVRAAASWFERGLDLDPASAANLAGLGKVVWARGNVARAVELLREAVELSPAVEHAATLGDLYRVTGRPTLAREQDAVVEATRALAASSGVNVDLEIALFDADHGRPGPALEAARAEWSRRRSVHVADAYAWALYANGRFEDAARIVERALALGTRDATFLFHAGMIERALGHDGSARRLLREALATNPHFSILHAPTARRTLAGLEGTR